MDKFGGRNKPTKKADDSLDDLLGDLLEPDETPKKKPAQGRGRPAGTSGGKDDFYSNLAAMAENDVDSDMSDADVGKMAKSIAGLDDMDADLFGDSLKKKNSVKGNSKPSTPRKSGNVPRVASPTRSDTTTSPPGSARGSLKRKPVKPSSSATPSINMQPPGTAPGKMTDLGRASENLRPGQPKEEQRPGTVPRMKKIDFGDFDEDDPLAGLSLDEDSISEAKKKPAAAKAVVKEQKSLEEEPKPAQPLAQPSSPRKPSLFDRPPTRSGSGVAGSDTAAEAAPPPKQAEPAPKRKEEMIFSDDDNFLDGLGIDAGEKKAAPVAATPAAAKSRSILGDDEDTKPAKSVMDGLLGRGQKTASSLLETKEKPRTFVLDKKYTQPKENKKEDEDDFLFGNYQPSSAVGSTAGSSRPGSRRSVRFQDDDDIFGLDKPSAGRPGSSGSLGTRSVPDDMKWLEELTGGGDTTPSSNRSANTAPPSPAKTPTAARPSSAVKNSPAVKPADRVADDIFGKSTVSDTPKLGGGMSAKDSILDSLAKSSPREASPERKGESAASKLDSKDWLGLKDSDSDGELFIPKRVASRSPGVVDTTPRTPSSAGRPRGTPKSASPTKEVSSKKSDDEEEDSFIARAKARRQAAMGNQAKAKETGGSVGAPESTTFLTQPDSPHFEGSVPPALKEGTQEARDLFAVPPARGTSSAKFETSPRRNSLTGVTANAEADPMKLVKPHAVSMSTGIGGENTGRTFQSSHFSQRKEDSQPGNRYDRFSSLGPASMESPEQQLQQLQQQQQHSQPQQQLQQLQQQMELQQRLQQEQQLRLQLQQQQQQQQALSSATSGPTLGGGVSFSSQGIPQTNESVLSGSYMTTAVAHGPIPASLQDAIAQIRMLEIEKQYSDSLLESTRKRYEEEILAIEKSYKNRMQILEESNQKSESRLRGETERLMEEHLAKVKRMEQEKSDLAAENFRRLEDQERTLAQDLEKLKEKHRQATQDLKKDHEEAQQQLLEAKNKEILKVASSHDTSKTLTAAVEQIENNARDLGQLQIKLDEWNRSGLDEREIAFRSKDEQLKMLQARLVKQEEDNERERHRLEDLIARMESQNREQLRQLEEERWKLKQEQSRVEAQQQTLENERRTWAEQHARERQSLDRARDMFLEEQQSGLSHLTDERRNLAEERSKLNMEQKVHREKVQQDSVRTAQAQAEYDVLCKTISEEKARAAERMRELHREEERISVERDRFHDRTAALEQEKQRLEKVALNVKQRSAELDAISDDANRTHEKGERAISESRLLHSQLDQRQAEVEALQASVKGMEEHIAQEKLRLAKEKKDVENLKQAGLCISCRSMFQGGPNQVMQKSGNLLAGTNNAVAVNPLAGAPYPSAVQDGVSGMTVSSVMYESVASSIASDRAVRMWKIQAIKDQEYLEEESMFLEGLRHSPYHSNSKV